MMAINGRMGLGLALMMLASQAAWAAPKIACPEPEFKFGEKESGLNVEASFVIRNEGDQPLQIGKVLPGCGCTSAKITEKVIEPGKETKLTAVLSLKYQKGPQRKEVTIESNDPATPKYVVYLVGNAVSPLMVTPDRLFFGQVDAHAGPSRTVELVAPTPDKEFQIIRVEAGEPQSMSVKQEEVEKGKKYRVTVTLSKQLTPGEFQSFVRVRTDNPQFDVIGIPVTATVAGELAVAPAQLRLTERADGKAITTYIMVSPGTVKNFKIMEIVPPLPGVTAKAIPTDQNGYRIKISDLLANDQLNGKSLVIKTDVKEMPEIRIPIYVAKQGHRPPTTKPAQAAAALPATK